MKSGIKATFFVAFLLFLTSCTYDFSEDYFHEIETKDPNVNISLTGFKNGGEINSSGMVQYTFTGVGNAEFEMIVKVDDAEVYWSQERTGEFFLAVDNLDEGTHTLTIEFAFPTNSGSLAGSLGGEYFIGAAVYNFVIDKSLANSFGIASVNIVQGSIYIKLNPVTDDNFEEAYLLILDETGYLLEERLISREDLKDLEIHDDQTIIYNPRYAIRVKNEFTEDTSETVMLHTPKMELSAEPLGYESFKLIYNEHPLYANFDKIGFTYYNYLRGASYHDLQPRGGETTIDQSYFFGEEMLVNLQIYKNDVIYGNISEQIQIGSTLPVSNFEEITYIPTLTKYFILDVNPANELVIYQLNRKSFEVEKSKTIATLDFSGDFKSLEVDPVSNALIINLNERALLFNPTTFSVASTYRARDYNSAKASADVYSRGKYVILEDPWPSGEVVIYETATKNEKFRITKTTNFFSAVDASFFYANGGLYKLQEGEFVFLNNIRDSENNRDAPPLDHMTFDKKSNSAVFGWYRNTYYLNLSNLTQTYIWAPDAVYNVKYTADGKPFINSSHFSAGTKSHLYNASTNETRIINTYGEQAYRYFDGVIFSPNGIYLESDLYVN